MTTITVHYYRIFLMDLKHYEYCKASGIYVHILMLILYGITMTSGVQLCM